MPNGRTAVVVRTVTHLYLGLRRTSELSINGQLGRDPSSPGQRVLLYRIFGKLPKVTGKLRLVNEFHHVGEFVLLDGCLRWNCPTGRDSSAWPQKRLLMMIQLSAVTVKNVGHAELPDP
jgi:hypothetical protein